MRSILLKIQSEDVASFNARRDLTPAVNNRWHYHEELELVYFRNGEGTQFIGDDIRRFNNGDVVLVGSNLPHYWRFDQDYFLEDGRSADVYVMHFKTDFLGDTFLNSPENSEIKKMIGNSAFGLQIETPNKQTIINLITQTVETSGYKRLLYLLETLHEISEYIHLLKPIASFGFRHNVNPNEQEQIQAIYNYTLNNYKRKISLIEIADIAKVSVNSFCKFFKKRSKKNYTDFVNEIRVGQACKLLIENKLRIKEICFESGFNNFASFHKCFKKITGQSPLQYQKTFVKN